jgi:hypothetical protein
MKVASMVKHGCSKECILRPDIKASDQLYTEPTVGTKISRTIMIGVEFDLVSFFQ